MLTSINELLGTKIAECNCNEIIMSNIELMMNIKAAI